MKRVDTIDGLRAIAMTMVVAQHCRLLPFGWTGVWLFFVISGYVITKTFAPSDGPGPSRWSRFLDFMHRRAIRIVPVYLLYLAVNVAALLALHRTEPLWNLPYLLGFAFNWQMIFGLSPGSDAWPAFGHLWTLSVEQQFYLLFPVLMLAVAPGLQTRVTIALIAIGPCLRWGSSALLSRVWSHEPESLAFAIYAASIAHFDAFLLGSLLVRFERSRVAAAKVDRWLLPLAMGGCAVYVASYLAVNHAHGARGIGMLRNLYSGILYGEGREIFCYLSVDLIAAAVLWRAARVSSARHWLNQRWVVWVGRVSYGGYLFHALLLALGARWFGHPVDMPLPERVGFFIALWVLTVGLASASFVYFETPLARKWVHSAGLGVRAVRERREATRAS